MRVQVRTCPYSRLLAFAYRDEGWDIYNARAYLDTYLKFLSYFDGGARLWVGLVLEHHFVLAVARKLHVCVCE